MPALGPLAPARLGTTIWPPMCLALAFAASACGGSSDDGTPAATGDSAPPTTASPTGDPIVAIAEGADLPAAALLSIWGTSASDIWAVGADDGTGPVLIHFDGTNWNRIDTGTSGDLWWVWGDGQGTLFLSGAGGRVVEHDIAGGTFTEHAAADPELTLFGLWGTSATDVWTVGGNVNGARNGGIIHYDGTTWTEVAQPEGKAFRSAFKVWGTAPDDVWVVGTGALITHWDGTAFTEVDPSPVYETTTLTTVAGGGGEVYAVGGFGNATVARFDGSGWTNDSPPPEAIAPGFNGVHVRGDHVIACGARGAVWQRDATGGWGELAPPATTYDLHGCWIDPDGHVWSVGGDLISLTAGVIVSDAPDAAPFSL